MIESILFQQFADPEIQRIFPPLVKIFIIVSNEPLGVDPLTYIDFESS